jgi:HD-GYP domain-containing protein (c-di-GMP phosphodiesterase class II)
MVRISDTVNKRFKEEGEGKPRPSEVRVSLAAVKEGGSFPVEEKKEGEVKPGPLEIRVSPAAVKQGRALPIEETEKLYNELLFLAEDVLTTGIDRSSVDIARITGAIKTLIDELKSGNEDILKLALICNPQDVKNYLSYHSVNISIFSLVIGLFCGYGQDRLLELGISAFFHDIGMVKYLALAGRPQGLSTSEYDEVKGHTRSGVDILRHFGNALPEAVIQATSQHHERADGSGYPGALKGSAISEYARIISLADVYEAMTHPRAYRPEHTPFEAVKEILNNKKTFEYKLLKALIEKIGIFPVGSFVELNNGKTAQVINLNPGSPLRPVVEIAPDTGREEGKKEILDITANCNVAIRRGIKKSELQF